MLGVQKYDVMSCSKYNRKSIKWYCAKQSCARGAKIISDVMLCSNSQLESVFKSIFRVGHDVMIWQGKYKKENTKRSVAVVLKVWQNEEKT